MGQKNTLFAYKNDRLRPLISDIVSKPEMQDTAFAAVVLDVGNNDYSDPIITRATGVWLHLNEGCRFTVQKLNLPIKADTTPIYLASIDINHDGHFDMYIFGYIKK